jgi:Zn finger protein HypA/HybF involved in hydrogenase expression
MDIDIDEYNRLKKIRDRKREYDKTYFAVKVKNQYRHCDICNIDVKNNSYSYHCNKCKKHLRKVMELKSQDETKNI